MTDLGAWPALVLTAGLATRLRPLSDVRAKPALPVAGQPLVGRILRWLHDAGVRRVVLNLHHRPETVTGAVGDGAEWGLQARYSWETAILGSAGGPKRALPLLDADRFLIVNGDTLTDCDLRAVADRHLATGALVTMAVVEKTVERYAFVDDEDIVQGFGDAHAARRFSSAITPLHYIGVQAVDAAAFDSVPDDQPHETVKQLYPNLIARFPGSVRACRSSAEFLDVGTPADYLETVDAIARREGRELDRGSGTIVHPSATVRHSILWDRIVVHPHAELIDCVVGDNVEIAEGDRFQRSAIVQGVDGLIVKSF